MGKIQLFFHFAKIFKVIIKKCFFNNQTESEVHNIDSDQPTCFWLTWNLNYEKKLPGLSEVTCCSLSGETQVCVCVWGTYLFLCCWVIWSQREGFSHQPDARQPLCSHNTPWEHNDNHVSVCVCLNLQVQTCSKMCVCVCVSGKVWLMGLSASPVQMEAVSVCIKQH